jgi:hypothetical protein
MNAHRLNTALVLLAFTATGCGTATHEKYVPKSTQAEIALDTALMAWKDNEPAKDMKIDDEVSVELHDARWQKGAKLKSFEILEELPDTQQPTFKVRIRLADKKADEETNYVVIGMNPLLVFRAEDYERTSGVSAGM